VEVPLEPERADVSALNVGIASAEKLAAGQLARTGALAAA
jgi:hypothetical protein